MSNDPTSTHRPRRRALAWLTAVVCVLGLAVAAHRITTAATDPTTGPRSVDQRSSTPAPAPAAPARSTSPPPTTAPTSPTSPPPTAAPGPPWLPAARGFAEAFTRPLGPRRWRAGITRWTTPELAESYTTVDPRQIPTGTLSDLETSAAGEASADVTVTYDSGLRILIRLEDGPTGWKVTTATRR